jgi:hypothetical protein
MATKKSKTPAPQLQTQRVSQPAFTHNNILKVVDFDGAGHLLCTDSGGGWSAWRLEDGERLHHTPCLDPNLRKPGPLRALRAGAWMGWDGANEQLAAVEIASGVASPLSLPRDLPRRGSPGHRAA